MSKQLAISASVSVFLMAAFAFAATAPGGPAYNDGLHGEGATTVVAAPSIGGPFAAPFDIID